MFKLDYSPKAPADLTADEYEMIHGWEFRSKNERILAKPFQHFLNAAKDVVDTFKPYKGRYQFWRDLAQPFYGIGNLLVSAINAVIAIIIIVCTPFSLLYYLCSAIYSLSLDQEARTEHNEDLAVSILDFFSKTIALFTQTINAAIRGITQIATTPLAWFIKIPLRVIITAVVTDGFKNMPKMEDSSSVQQLLGMANEKLEPNELVQPSELSMETILTSELSMETILKALHMKAVKGYNHKQSTNIDDSQESQMFVDLIEKVLPIEHDHKQATKDAISSYLRLFTQKNNAEMEDIILVELPDDPVFQQQI